MTQQIPDNHCQRNDHVEGEIARLARWLRLKFMGWSMVELDVGDLVIHPGGKVDRHHPREVIFYAHGLLQGEVIGSTGLLDIGTTGSVNGEVLCMGQLAMKPKAANLSADVRNIPPTLAGDMKLTVTSRARRSSLTTDDLTAIDPDDEAKDLKFCHVTNMKNGFVVSLDKPKDRCRKVFHPGRARKRHHRLRPRWQAKRCSPASNVSVTDKPLAQVRARPKTVEVEVRG